MGAYLSQPKTDKVSTDELNDMLAVGASSMQGWRNSQEDAHNSILSYDTNTSFFAVYDGHGGAEVATYCADKLPTFLKELPNYKDGDLEQALKDAFLGFDKSLLEPEVVEILKILAGEKNFVDHDDSDAREEDDEDVEDLAELHKESYLPLNEVLEKYQGGGASMPSLKRVKDAGIGSGPKPHSPYLRGRRAAAVAADAANRAVMDPDAHPQGSSTSAAAAAAAGSSSSSLNCAGPSSSKSSSSSSLSLKMDTDEPEEDSTVSSSSSSSAGKTNNSSNNILNEDAKAEDATADAKPIITTNGSPQLNTNTAAAASDLTSSVAPSATAHTNAGNLPDSSHIKESDQNGSVTTTSITSCSTETKSITKGNVDASTDAVLDNDVSASVVSGSNDVTVAKRIQNGTVGSSTSSSSSTTTSPLENSTVAIGIARSAISSTSSKILKKSKKLTDGIAGDDDSTDDDADYDAENDSADESDPRHVLEFSSEEDMDDDDEDGDDEEEDDDEDDEEEDEDEEDEESVLANEQFCANMIEEPGKDSGCTAVVALLQGRDLYVANAGDSRCVVCRNGKAIDMSLDHKPEDDEESARIIKAGGRVTVDGRVNGGLNLSRAIGDHAYKMNAELKAEEQMISALPDVKKLIISPDDEFMVLACDGIWNYMSSEEVVDFVRIRLKDETKKVSQICEELFDNCLAPNTMGDGTGCDNMTAVIVRFQPKVLELPTKINPEECEDVMLLKKANEPTDNTDANLLKSMKRSINATDIDGDGDGSCNEATKTKRLKTDGGVDGNECDGTTETTLTDSNGSAASSANITTTTTSSNKNNSDSDINTTSSTTNAAEQKECDSVNITTTAASTLSST